MPAPPPFAAEETQVQRALAGHRLRFLTGDPVDPAVVRSPILASWQRSRDLRVTADVVAPLQAAELESDTPLDRAAGPVLRSLASVLDGQPVSVVLTDRHGLVLSRHTNDRALERRLDRAGLAPGFDYGEHSVGTNGIGTALEVGAPTHVFGHEHFAEHLEDLACAGVPIRHPVTGRTVGLVDLTCWQSHAGSLLMALATTTARQVQDALMSQATSHERELLEEFLRTCRRTVGVVLAVSDSVTMVNEYSKETLTTEDQAHLLRCAAEAMADRQRLSVDVELGGGHPARLLLNFVGEPGPESGVVARVVPTDARTFGHVATPEHPESRPLPGLVGSGPAWLRACAQVETTFRSGEWLALTGEPGVGKRSILRAVQLRGQPVPSLRVLDARTPDADTWVAELQAALDEGRSNLLLLDVDRLDARTLRSCVELLRQHRSRPGPPTPWVGASLSGSAESVDLRALLDCFPATVRVPPLRLHATDIVPLTRHFTQRVAGSRRLVWSEEALRALSTSTWPGNVAQLHHVVRSVMRVRRSGVVDPAHLPSEVRSVARRSLSVIESLERDAIASALSDAHGDRAAAAEALGLSRATIYRRIRAFGIVDSGW